MSAQVFELVLAKLYADKKIRDKFLISPEFVIGNYNLTASEKNHLLQIDKAGLIMASNSYMKKKQKRILTNSFKSRLIFFKTKLVSWFK